MANKKISELDAASALTGSELLPLVQSSNTKQTSVNDIGVITKKVSLTSAQVLALNSAPVQLVGAPGSGKFIQVVAVTASVTYAGPPYSTNVGLQIYFNSTYILFANGLGGSSGVLLTIDNSLQNFAYTPPNSGNSEVLINTPLMLNVGGGNPVGGNSPLDIYITYRVVSL